MADCANHTRVARYPDYPVLKVKMARITARKRKTDFSGGVPRVTREPGIVSLPPQRSNIQRRAEDRRRNPTRAERQLEHILNGLNGGVLRGRFKREHAISGKWIVDFFFPEIRLAIEVDGPVHLTKEQQIRDREKDADCKRFDVTVLRLRNKEVLGNRRELVERLRVGWRRARGRENRIIGKVLFRRAGRVMVAPHAGG